MNHPPTSTPCLTGLALLALIAVARSHGDDSHQSSDSVNMDMHPAPTPAAAANYLQLQEYSFLIIAHIFLMTVAWVFVLPVAVMFSIARSQLSLITQAIFLIINTTSIALVTIYNAKTPDLYPHNSHHKLGWWLTWIVCAQVVMAIIRRYTSGRNLQPNMPLEEQESFLPVSTAAMAEHQRIHDLGAGNHRFSNDSGQGTERNTESLRSLSISSVGTENDRVLTEIRCDYKDEDLGEVDKPRLMCGTRMDRFLSKALPSLLSLRALGFFTWVYNLIDRLILILGFIALTTGIATYGGLFMGGEVFSGLAHFIKGGIFFWYGILTLGRWAGCFADIGWAWNVKPSKAQKLNRPSAEFVESFLIFFYGATNVFLEHLAAWGKEWTAQDLEHISITIMFFGGGLCGMFVESAKIRTLLNASLSQIRAAESRPQFSSGLQTLEQPKTYNFSMNPIPALIVLLLGMMMSSHHQQSMVSAMIHKQWGTLLVGAAFSRTLTYLIYYLAPPTSIFPGRPPSEIITAFCLMAGGFIFMASSKDTIATIELHNLDAMFIFTVAMGVITFLMAWIVLVISIKGWAIRRERSEPSTVSSAY